MLNTRRLFLNRALQTAGGLIGGSLLPRKAYAGCKSSTESFEMEEGMLSIPNWKLGDCELRQASLRISGNFLIFNGQVATHFTHTKDVWHIHLLLFTRNNTDPSKKIILLDKSFDGPQMSELDEPLFHTWAARFPISNQAAQTRRIAVQITSCC
jgi:hypothetical protein